jgi:DNA-binding transcriptional MerR regulator
MDGHYQHNKRFNLTYDIFCCVFYNSNHIRFCNFIYGYMGLFDIYSKEDWRTIMAKEKEIRLEKVLQDMSFSLKHIEDIMADDRQLLVKLVKQNNTIVDYLKQLEIDIVEEYENGIVPELSEEEQQRIKKAKELKEVLNEFMDKRKDLKEFEKELKKNKDMLTPGQVGDA